MADQFTTIFDLNREMTLTTLPVIIFIGLIAVIGAIGNCIVIYIYSQKYPKCNFKYFVLLLAGLDLISCCILMPLEIVTFLNWFVYPSSALCKVKSFLNAFTVCSSATSLLLIAIDRYRKVCRPHGRQMTHICAIKLSILVLGISAIPAASDAVFWGLHTFQVSGSNLTATVCEKDDAYKDTIGPTIHTAVLYAGTNMLVMFSTIVLYILIALKLFCVVGPEAPSTPDIRISPSIVSPDTERSVQIFKFDSAIESGLSESEDGSTRNSIETLDEATKDISDRNSNSIPLEDTVVLREKSDHEADRASRDSNVAKAVRLSLEILQEDARRSNNLRVPEIQMRRKQSVTKVPRSPKHAYGRRRSTVGSLRGVSSLRLRRKTLIMFILTAVFVGTTFLYFCLISIMSHRSNLFNNFSAPERTAWLFFLRLYFVNSLINPILYGFLDPRFKKSLWNMGVRIQWLAGSLKKNLSVKVSKDADDNVTVRIKVPKSKRPLSSTTLSE